MRGARHAEFSKLDVRFTRIKCVNLSTVVIPFVFGNGNEHRVCITIASRHEFIEFADSIQWSEMRSFVSFFDVLFSSYRTFYIFLLFLVDANMQDTMNMKLETCF